MRATVGEGSSFKSANLSMGVHPAILVGVSAEAIPAGWEMGKKHSHMWRWHFLAWETDAHYQAGQEPEELDPVSSPVLTPASSFQASKAYTILTEILGRHLGAGEEVDFDVMLPTPCRIMTSNIMKPGQQQTTCILERCAPPDPWQLQAPPPAPIMMQVNARKAEIQATNNAFQQLQSQGQPATGWGAPSAPAPAAAPTPAPTPAGWGNPPTPAPAPAPTPAPAPSGWGNASAPAANPQPVRPAIAMPPAATPPVTPPAYDDDIPF